MNFEKESVSSLKAVVQYAKFVLKIRAIFCYSKSCEAKNLPEMQASFSGK